MAISTNQKPTIYRNLYENTGPEYSREDDRIHLLLVLLRKHNKDIDPMLLIARPVS